MLVFIILLLKKNSKNTKLARKKPGRILLLLKRAMCEKASGVLSSLATKKHLNKIPLVGPLLF